MSYCSPARPYQEILASNKPDRKYRGHRTAHARRRRSNQLPALWRCYCGVVVVLVSDNWGSRWRRKRREWFSSDRDMISKQCNVYRSTTLHMVQITWQSESCQWYQEETLEGKNAKGKMPWKKRPVQKMYIGKKTTDKNVNRGSILAGQNVRNIFVFLQWL